jgi:hypothetical protein
MSFHMDVKVDKVLEDGVYDAVLKSVEDIATKYGQRLMWRFSIPAEGVEVVGFTSMSPSTRANAYLWAEAIVGQIDLETGWGPEDVEGRPCSVVLETYRNAQGIEKNKVTEVLPPKPTES